MRKIIAAACLMAAMTLCVGCSSAKDGSKDTTKATTEATTETTTINYNDSIIPGVSKALHKMVIQDLRLALNNYSLGSANTATRLANSYINRTTSNWLGMATTPEDKKFVAAAKGAYLSLIHI